MDINKAMSICFKNNLKVFPIKYDEGWKITAVHNKESETFDKIVNGKEEMNRALALSYIHFAKKFEINVNKLV